MGVGDVIYPPEIGEIPGGIFQVREDDEGEYLHPIGRVWRCRCGAEVESHSGHDTYCDRCHTDYNAFGQQLAPGGPRW